MIDAMLRELGALEPAYFRALAPVLAQAQRETAAALARFIARKDLNQRFSAQLQRELYIQLVPAMDKIKELDPALFKSLSTSRPAARGLAVKHVQAQLLKFAPRFGKTLGAPIPVKRAARIAEGSSTRIKIYKRSARRYAGAVGQDIRAQLAIGTVRKETLRQMTNRLVKLGGPRGMVNLGPRSEYISEGLFVKYRGWAHRIVRTEIISQYNDAAHEGIKELHKIDRGIMMRWDASLDGRMCSWCESLNGKVALPGESFDGIDHPPAHPNCRCALTAWRKDWDELG